MGRGEEVNDVATNGKLPWRFNLSDTLVTARNQMSHQIVPLNRCANFDKQSALFVNAERNCRLADSSGRCDNDSVLFSVKGVNGGDAVAGDGKVSVARKQGRVWRERVNSVGLTEQSF